MKEAKLCEIPEVSAVSEGNVFLEIRLPGPGKFNIYFVPKIFIDKSSEVRKKGDFGTLVVQYWWARQKGIHE